MAVLFRSTFRLAPRFLRSLTVFGLSVALLSTGVGAYGFSAQPNREDGTLYAGQIPDTNPATIQLIIGPPRGDNAVCSGVYVAPGVVLTAGHCFEKFTSNSLIRIFEDHALDRTNSDFILASRLVRSDTQDMAVVYTPDTDHPYAQIDPTPLKGGERAKICGINYISVQSTDIDQPSTYQRSGPDYCQNVSVLPEVYEGTTIPFGTIATLPPAIEQGDSGGPLYNEQGLVVGITGGLTQQPTRRGDTLLYNRSVRLSSYRSWFESLGIALKSDKPAPAPAAPGAAPAPAQPQPPKPVAIPGTFNRISGSDRVETSVRAAASLGKRNGIILATGINAADGLAATQLARLVDSPLLLSLGSAEVSPAAWSHIETSGATTVYRVGGTAKISEAERLKLFERGVKVVDLVSADRFATAVEVAKYRDTLAGAPETILLADGMNYPDALAAGAVAAQIGASLVLTQGQNVPPVTAQYLRSYPGAKIYAVGGPASRAAKAASLPLTGDFVGADRYDTALRVLSLVPATTASLVAVSGSNFPDALSGGAWAALSSRSLVLVPPPGIAKKVLSGVWQAGGRNMVAIGGENALPSAALASALGL